MVANGSGYQKWTSEVVLRKAIRHPDRYSLASLFAGGVWVCQFKEILCFSGLYHRLRLATLHHLRHLMTGIVYVISPSLTCDQAGMYQTFFLQYNCEHIAPTLRAS